jgi:hypothetical protein
MEDSRRHARLGSAWGYTGHLVAVQQVAQADSAECHAACGRDGQASCHPAATPLSHTVGEIGALSKVLWRAG